MRRESPVHLHRNGTNESALCTQGPRSNSSSSDRHTHVLHHGASDNGLDSLSVNLQGTRISSLCRVPSLQVRRIEVHQLPRSSRSAASLVCLTKLLCHRITRSNPHRDPTVRPKFDKLTKFCNFTSNPTSSPFVFNKLNPCSSVPIGRPVSRAC